jgi:hypothetical protein
MDKMCATGGGSAVLWVEGMAQVIGVIGEDMLLAIPVRLALTKSKRDG